MNLTDLTAIANGYTDENFSTTLTKLYADEAISQINIELRTNLPAFPASASISYTALSDDWLKTVVALYMAYSIKMNDGSLNEADRFFVRYQNVLSTLKKEKSYAIPVAYQGDGFIGSLIWVTATETEWDNCPTDYQVDLGTMDRTLLDYARLTYDAKRVNALTVMRSYDSSRLEYSYVKIGIGKSFKQLTIHQGPPAASILTRDRQPQAY